MDTRKMKVGQPVEYIPDGRLRGIIIEKKRKKKVTLFMIKTLDDAFLIPVTKRTLKRLFKVLGK